MSRVLENKFLQILIALAIPFIFAAIFGIGSSKNMYPWYTNLERPTWTPPDWIFAPVWAYLYATMGYASYLVFDSHSELKRTSLAIYGIQLFFNVTWTQVFFNFHLLGWSTIHILVLLVLVYATGILFYKVNRLAGLLILPYALWGSFASALCVAIWRMNIEY